VIARNRQVLYLITGPKLPDAGPQTIEELLCRVILGRQSFLCYIAGNHYYVLAAGLVSGTNRGGQRFEPRLDNVLRIFKVKVAEVNYCDDHLVAEP
jgi:hypothetical protein